MTTELAPTNAGCDRGPVPVAGAVTTWLAAHRPMVIGDAAVDSEHLLVVEDPATGDRLAEVSAAGPEHVARAVARARRAFEDGQWRWMPSAERSRTILAAATTIERHAEELAQLDALDGGVPISMSRASVAASIEVMEYAAGIPARITGESLAPTSQRGDRFHAEVIREPMGVVGVIAPWNVPFSMAMDKVILALATGNTVVLKPAEQTPLSALRLGELLLEAGLPPGVLNVVPGKGAVAGTALVQDPRVDKISFTGSTATGKRIVAAAAINLTPVCLELGGKSPYVVFADADLPAAVKTAASNAFLHSGQACTQPSRIFVQRGVYDEFLAGLCREAESFAVGPPMDPASMAGPVVSSAQRDRVLGFVEAGIRDGAEIAYRGQALPGSGYYVAPTVLTGTTRDMTVEREEVFGPVVSVSPFDDVDEVISRANDTAFGLAAGVWTNDLSLAHRTSRELRAGTVWINTYNLFDAGLPFGGVKQSGWGREGGTASIEVFTQTKTVTTGLSSKHQSKENWNVV